MTKSESSKCKLESFNFSLKDVIEISEFISFNLVFEIIAFCLFMSFSVYKDCLCKLVKSILSKSINLKFIPALANKDETLVPKAPKPTIVTVFLDSSFWACLPITFSCLAYLMVETRKNRLLRLLGVI